MNDFMNGRLIAGRYQIADRIGMGGMAEVYRAQDIVLGRTVAIKIMLPQYAADPAFTLRFKQEAASAANLQNPFIVNVYDWGQDSGIYYIVMEYLRGSDLKACIQQRGAINQRKVAEIGMQVCQALNTAHHLDIVHRDIKPQNIMIQPDGNIKVMDFGISRAKNSVMTRTSSVLGTAHYISPEQAQGKELTQASDIYSLGVVLYEAATGVLPFDGPDAVSVALKQVNEQPRPLHQVKPDIDPIFESIVLKALAKDPYARFATANEMRIALNNYLTGQPVNGVNPSFNAAKTAVMGGFNSAETSVIGNRAAGMNIPPDKTSVMAGGVGANYGMQGKHSNMNGANSVNYRQNASQDFQPEQKKKKTAFIVAIIVAVLAIAGGLFFFFGNSKVETAEVPNVTGKTYEEAVSVLQDAGFSVGSTTKENSEDVEEGKIIKQDPSANSKAEKGSKVNLVVSKGPGEVEVPSLEGKTATEAQEILEKAGLKPHSGEAKYSSEVEVNHIISQSPAAGTKVDKGSQVSYVLSLGEENVEIPYVVDQKEDEAIAALQNAGFSVYSTTSASDTVAKGKVMSQNPTGSAVKGSTVSIVISTGSEKPSPTPDPKDDDKKTN